MKRAPRLYTDWRRPSRERNRRIVFLLAMLALTGFGLWLFGATLPPLYGGWP